MAVKPSSNNRFGRGSLVSDIAGVSKTNTVKKMTAEDIIKKKQTEAAAKETVVEEVVPEVKAEVVTPVETKPEETIERTEATSTIQAEVPVVKKIETVENAEIPVAPVAPVTPSYQEQSVMPVTPVAPSYQEQSVMPGNMYDQPVNQQPAYGYNQYQPYTAPNYGNYGGMPQQMAYPYGNAPVVSNPNGEFHKTTDYNMFEDYPDINVRLPLKTGGDREMLKKSIMESGIADPIIVAPVQDVIKAFSDVQFQIPAYPPNVQFIIIAGQNRRSLAKETGVELPFIIKRGLTKEQMDTIGLDTNLLNRQFSAMKPSEQVYIVNRRRALFEQNNTRNIRGKLSEITGYEKTYIYQLLSLVHVKKELLTDFVDPGYISVSGITHLVTVPFDNQERLYDFLIKNGIKKVMANQMKALLQDTTTPWNDIYLTNIMFPDKKKYSNITLRPDQYHGIIPDEDLPKASEIIIKALKEYYQKQN